MARHFTRRVRLTAEPLEERNVLSYLFENYGAWTWCAPPKVIQVV
jgi:hypothetical protein